MNWRLLNENDVVFVDLSNIVDNVIKMRTEMGLRVIESAEPVSTNMEDQIWQTGVLGEHSPAQLLDTVMFLIGVNAH